MSDGAATGLLLDAAAHNTALRSEVGGRGAERQFAETAVPAVAAFGARASPAPGEDFGAYDTPPAPRSGSSDLPDERTGVARKADTAAPADGGHTPAPQVAGLVADALSLGLTALERAIQDFTEPLPSSGRSGTAVLYCLGLSSGLLGGVLAYELARRRATASGRATLGQPSLFPEEAS